MGGSFPTAVALLVDGSVNWELTRAFGHIEMELDEPRG